MTKQGNSFYVDAPSMDKKYYFLSYSDTRENAIWLQLLSITPRVSVGYNMNYEGSPGIPKEAFRAMPIFLLEGWLLETSDSNL